MKLDKINLVNFRNYKKIEISFNEKINIFIGNNAQGKTNILESIYILSITKSHRFNNENNLIKHNEEKAIIKGKISDNKLKRELEVNIFKDKKKIFINKTEIRKLSEYISNLITIVFTPEDLNIIKDSPQIRRNLLNIELCQFSSHYLKIYNEYNKILKMRNDFLKKSSKNININEDYFKILTEKLVDRGIIIYNYRKEFIEEINKKVGIIYEDISNFNNLIIKYETNVDLSNKNNIKNDFENKLISNYEREKNQGSTTIGPHRDDFVFSLNGKDLKYYGSQGQQRLAIISFKLSEISIFENKINKKPVLLLDDIFSELDKTKKNKLINYLNGDIQTIITTTDIKDIKKSMLKNATIFEIKEGIIEKRK